MLGPGAQSGEIQFPDTKHYLGLVNAELFHAGGVRPSVAGGSIILNTHISTTYAIEFPLRTISSVIIWIEPIRF